MIIIQLQVLWPICRPLLTVPIFFSKGKIYFGCAAVVAHRRCSLRLDGTKARLVLWNGEIWSIKLDGDKAYVVHWYPLQGNDFGSHCALRLKYVSFFDVLLVHLGISLLCCFGWVGCSLSGNGALTAPFFPTFSCSLTVGCAHRCKLCRLLRLNVMKCLRCFEVRFFVNDHYVILFMAKLRHSYTNGNTEVLAKFGRISCPFNLAGIDLSWSFICVMALSGSQN